MHALYCHSPPGGTQRQRREEFSIGKVSASLKVKIVFWLLIKWRYLTERRAIIEHFSLEVLRGKPGLPER